MKSLNIAAGGMLAQQTNVEVISNNLSNMKTIGYKRQRPEFQDLIYQNAKLPGTPTSGEGTAVTAAGIQVGLGVKMGSISRIVSQGPIASTSNALDFAIQGAGYLVFKKGDEEVFSRAGHLELSPSGVLVTADGLPLQPTITIPQTALAIAVTPTGEVLATLPKTVEPQSLGQIELATFVNPAGLLALGSNFFRETAASGAPNLGEPGSNNIGTILQGYLEESNVDPINEITSLVAAQRAFEMNSKVVQVSDEMMGIANQMRRG